MSVKLINNLLIIENGHISNIILDDKAMWELGRVTSNNLPDIKLHIQTVSREHGRFQNLNGEWFYIDRLGKNGTFYNKKKLMPGLKGKAKALMLEDGDTFAFGAGDVYRLDSKTVFALFLKKQFENGWRVEDTKDMDRIKFQVGNESYIYNKPEIGMVLSGNSGIIVYYGDESYLTGDARIMKE